jgi:fatty acid desaturase
VPHQALAQTEVRREGARGTFEELSKLVKDAGLMRPRPGYYTVKMALNAVLPAAGAAAFALVGDSWWQLAVAAYLAFMFTQTDLVGHDVGHRQVTRNQRLMDVFGYLHGNLLTGVSFGWWVTTPGTTTSPTTCRWTRISPAGK